MTAKIIYNKINHDSKGTKSICYPLFIDMIDVSYIDVSWVNSFITINFDEW